MYQEHDRTAFPCPIYNIADFTFYHPQDEQAKLIFKHHLQNSADGFEARFSYDCSLKIRNGEADAQGRVLACSCFGGQLWSLTFRHQGDTGKDQYPPLRRLVERSSFTADDRIFVNGQEETLNSIGEICRLLYQLIFGHDKHEAQGIVVITGSTASAKSKIARGLIELYLQARRRRSAPGQRRQHLITFEDPIEKLFYAPDPQHPVRYGVDYTPRQKGQDADSLRSVVNDALRQTPAVLYVGEMRNFEDWSTLIEFGGTGHLAVTTAHAGSLTEAMGRIFQATGAKTPARRSEIADCLRAVIHLRRDVIEGKMILIPALWRYTLSGSKSLVADGLASLLPHRHETAGSLGRNWFTDRLVQAAFERNQRDSERSPDEAVRRRARERNEELVACRHAIHKKAIEWDIEEI